MKLKDRNKFVPYGYALNIPEVGMKKTITGSFSTIVTAFAQIVAKNPALAQKQGWPTNRVDQENWIEQRECHRLIASGFPTFVEMDGVSPPINVGGASRNRPGENVVAAAKSIVAGVGVWIDLFGAEGKVVDKAEAERRATTCVACPLNDTHTSLKVLFIEKVAATIHKQYELLNEMSLRTSQDAKLGVCQACLCPTRSKVHVDLSHIKAHMSAEVESKLAPLCWIRE